MGEVILTMKDIDKSFPGVPVFTRRIPEQLHIKAKRQNFTIPVKLRMPEW